jgi:hypothetical protein
VIKRSTQIAIKVACSMNSIMKQHKALIAHNNYGIIHGIFLENDNLAEEVSRK